MEKHFLRQLPDEAQGLLDKLKPVPFFPKSLLPGEGSSFFRAVVLSWKSFPESRKIETPESGESLRVWRKWSRGWERLWQGLWVRWGWNPAEGQERNPRFHLWFSSADWVLVQGVPGGFYHGHLLIFARGASCVVSCLQMQRSRRGWSCWSRRRPWRGCRGRVRCSPAWLWDPQPPSSGGWGTRRSFPLTGE